MPAAALTDSAVEIAPGVHWVGALDPPLRSFAIILPPAPGTSYNSYVVRGESGVAVIDTVKESFADIFFQRLESVARYDEITTIVLNHLEPDHSGALPELLKRAPQAKVYLSSRAQMMLKARPTCIGRTRNAPIWSKTASCFPATCSAAISAMHGYSTTRSAISAFRSSITTRTSCGRSASTCSTPSR